MKKRTLLLISLAILGCCLVPAGCGGKKTSAKNNMFIDPSFENGGSAWNMDSDWSVINDPCNAYAGNYVAKYLYSAGNSNYRIWQTVQISEGEQISFSAMVKCTSSPTKDMHWYLVYWDKDGNRLPSFSSQPVVSSVWAESKGNAIAPAGAAKAEICLYIHSAESGSTAYADNFVCTVFDANTATTADSTASN